MGWIITLIIKRGPPIRLSLHKSVRDTSSSESADEKAALEGIFSL